MTHLEAIDGFPVDQFLVLICTLQIITESNAVTGVNDWVNRLALVKKYRANFERNNYRDTYYMETSDH